MARPKRQKVPLQVNQFVGGLNTEANPLSFPPTFSIDEQNMAIGRDGSRFRRNGFDVEQSHEVRSTGIASQTGLEIARNQFRWSNAGGSGNEEFMVVQIGNYVGIHDLNEVPLSSAPIYSKIFDSTTYATIFGFAVVDGSLVVATGEENFYVLSYKDGNITEKVDSLLIRDLFGVEATVNGVELTVPQELPTRPTSINSEHLYNLRNQTYGPARVKEANVGSNQVEDPITSFYAEESTYPSNSDNLVEFLFANPNNGADRTVERFQASSQVDSPAGNSHAPIGHFIINATDRGASRLSQEQKLRDNHPELDFSVSSLPTDKTPGGASVLAQYAGRIWYAGFSGDLLDGDSKSPRMSSYVLFSQVVQGPNDIGLCYQDADPTSNSDPNLVDTDGGFIKVDGAYNIKALIPVDTSLFVLAENGVWRIVGVDDNTFTATSYSVSKITEDGCVAAKSAVVNNNNLVYWGESGIFGISPSQIGDWEAVNLTQETIQDLYDSINSVNKTKVIGYYDADGRSFRWVWGSNEDTATESNELILNLKFSAFSREVVNLPSSIWGISSVAGGQTPVGSRFITVTSEGEDVTSSGESVTIPTTELDRGTTTAFYTVITSFDSDIQYTFGRYNNSSSNYDWVNYGNQADTPAFLLTGSVTGGDARLLKDVPYLTTYFNEESAESSCTLSARWNWTTNYDTGKWTSPREIFRKSRNHNDGDVVVTKTKIRGSGKSVAFKFESAPGQPMHIFGWEFNLEATEQE